MQVTNCHHPVSPGPLSRRAVLAVPVAMACLMMRPYEGFGAEVFAEGQSPRPGYVQALEEKFGAPNRNGFGSTVLFGTAASRDGLVRLAGDAYRYFVGDLWDRWGEAAWMGAWRLVFERTTSRDVVSELSKLPDPQTRLSADVILTGTEDPASSRAALAEAFDHPAVADLIVYNIGDGGAMSGLLVAARRTNGEATFLMFLMD